MILMIDNYDSFTYNVYQEIGKMVSDIQVVKNDEITLSEIEALHPDALIISPGPGDPDQAGISLAAIDYFKDKLPILGICLGHQSIGQAFGGKIVKGYQPMHGKGTKISVDIHSKLFYGLPERIQVARYHSLVIDANTIPECLQVIGEDDNHEIMAVQHKTYPIYGVQFHPESVLAQYGNIILYNFLHHVVGLQLEMDLEVPEEQRTALLPYIQKMIKDQSFTQEELDTMMFIIENHGASRVQLASMITLSAMKQTLYPELYAYFSSENHAYTYTIYRQMVSENE